MSNEQSNLKPHGVDACPYRRLQYLGYIYFIN